MSGTSAANNLHKAHVQYLEARLVKLGIGASNTKLENSTIPSLPGLSEAAQANMEAFIEKLLMVLPAIRVDLFTTKAKPDKPDAKKHSQAANYGPVFELTLKKEGIKATAILEDGEFVVQKGSLARASYIGERSDKSYYWRYYDKLVEQGILAEQGTHKVFTQSYAFASTSAAGACQSRRGAPEP